MLIMGKTLTTSKVSPNLKATPAPSKAAQKASKGGIYHNPPTKGTMGADKRKQP